MKHNTDKIRLNQMPKSNEEIEQVVAKMMLQIKIPYTAIKTKRDRFPKKVAQKFPKEVQTKI